LRYLVISDIHGNWEALDSILQAAANDSVDQVLVLGDLVGYGASPNEVVRKVSELTSKKSVVRGNHDKAVAGIEETESFNSIARLAVEWTTRELSAENLDFVRALPMGPLKVAQGLVICHGSPFDEDEYLFGLEDAERIFTRHVAQMTFFGHTHVPILLAADEERISVSMLEGDAQTVEIDRSKRYLINPGSVGQPRDRDPRAAYLIYDTAERRIIWRRQEYDLEKAQRRILDAGLPEVLAYRLAAGL
jgi:diadenosine tetraphosphatase ApaH/serine/threonine PP2A family protein phosphatase